MSSPIAEDAALAAQLSAIQEGSQNESEAVLDDEQVQDVSHLRRCRGAARAQHTRQVSRISLQLPPVERNEVLGHGQMLVRDFDNVEIHHGYVFDACDTQ